MSNSFAIGLDDKQFAEAMDRAKSLGLDPNATSGTLPESHGVALSYHITHGSPQHIITFDIVHKPALVSVSMIQRHVLGLLGLA